MCCLTSLSMAFVTWEDSATGQRSFKVMEGLLLGIEMMIECFQHLGTVPMLMEVWNRYCKTLPNWSAQCLRTQPLMLSAPGALLALDLLKALTTSVVTKVMGGLLGLRFDLMLASCMELFVSNLAKKELRSLGRDGGVLSGLVSGLLLMTEFTTAIPFRPCQAKWRFP